MLPLWTDDAHRKTLFGYCKTSRKPYDQVVAAILIAVKHHFGDDVLISGGTLAEEWLRGAAPEHDAKSPIKLYMHIFPERELPEDMLMADDGYERQLAKLAARAG